MTNNVLIVKTISKNLPKGVDWNSMFADANSKRYAERKSSFDSNIFSAIRIIENVLNQIRETANTYEDLDPKKMSAKCSPIINSLPYAKASPQGIPSPQISQQREMNVPNKNRNADNTYMNSNEADDIPSINLHSFSKSHPQIILSSEPTIIKAINDKLWSNASCGSNPQKPLCNAKLSKNTLTQIEKLYFNTQVMSKFLEDIGNNSDCRRYFNDFFKNRYIAWAYYIPNMEFNQNLFISICTETNKVTLNIVN